MYSTKALEFNLILDKIQDYAYSKAAVTAIKDTLPYNQLDEVSLNLYKSFELKQIIDTYGRLPFVKGFDIYLIITNLDKLDFLSIEDFLMIRRFIHMEKSLENYFKSIDSVHINHLEWIKTFKHSKSQLQHIDEIIKDDETIYDDASSTLKTIRHDLKMKERQLDKLLSEVLTRYQSYLNESIIVMRNGRYAIPIKEGYKNKVKGVIHDVSASKQTVYIEPEDIRQVTQDIEYLKSLEEQEIIQISIALTNKLKPFSTELISHLDILVELDVLHAKTLYAVEIDANLPNLNSDGNIHLIDARHPLIAKESVVPIEISISNDRNVLMITGPNTGGKTVALKTLGLFTLMMQSGILVPLNKNSQMSVFDQIFADIGDEQSIQQSLSTFSSHLTKIKNMFDKLKGRALILLDELGSGTDPIEGVSLAIAIIDDLKSNKNNRIILTTHYSELKLYAYEHDDIYTASVAFDEVSLKPLYKIHLGIAGSSHALKIADRLGLPKRIIHEAETLLSGRQTNLGKNIEKLNKEQVLLEQEKEVLKGKSEALDKEIKRYQDKIRTFEKERDQMLQDIKFKATKEYDKLKQDALEVIDKLSKVDKLSTPDAAKLKGDLNKTIKKETKVKLEPLKIGDLVLVTNYGQDGVITKINKDEYVVSVGLFELPFKRHELSKMAVKPKKQEKVQTKYSGSNPSKAPTFELDLRGVRFEEVKELMDKAIDDALLSNTPYIRVIHGFGTGAVRKAVYDYIKKSRYIKSHRYGQEGEGLNGVTVITL